MEELLKRLNNYPGAHKNERWKLETDLTRCTAKEKEAIKKLGYTIDDFMKAGLNRGEVAHILYGYKHTRR